MSTDCVIIGIDAAVDDKKVGLARAESSASGVVVTDVVPYFDEDRAAQWLEDAGLALLVAIDAPLGWPDGMREAFVAHVAGELLPIRRDDLFSRATDAEVLRVTKKRPFEVGADRIARTAHRALELLDSLRRRTGRPLRLAWSPGPIQVPSVIEVYPGATLARLGAAESARGYKKDRDVRRALVGRFKGLGITVEAAQRKVARESEHALDAILCALAGHHFAQGLCEPVHPSVAVQAQREGWIWLRRELA